MLFTISYSESTYPIIPVEPLKAIPYDYFGISVYLFYFIFVAGEMRSQATHFACNIFI